MTKYTRVKSYLDLQDSTLYFGDIYAKYSSSEPSGGGATRLKKKRGVLLSHESTLNVSAYRLSMRKFMRTMQGVHALSYTDLLIQLIKLVARN